MIADQTLYAVECVLVTVLAGAYGLKLLISWLGRRRPGLRIGRALTVALGARLLAAAALSGGSLGPTLRGADEPGFLARARGVAEQPLASGDLIFTLRSALHEGILALQIRFLDSPEFALRASFAVISVAGLTLLAVAVYDLAGARAATVAAWLLALEPSSLFFSSLLHKEPLMLLAEGLVAFGGASMWKRASLAAALPMAAGSGLALATRPYAGWFLIAVSAAITLHASVRASARLSARGIPLLMAAVLVVAMTGPIAWRGSDEKLADLQTSQDANATDDSNLRLDRVDFSTPSALARNLPVRIRDLTLRPYPWQVANTSQRLGLLGTAFLLVGLGFLLPALARSRHELMARAGPLIYLLMFMLTAYALATGNAGTGFRYRTHLVAIGICVTVVLREWNRYRVPARASAIPRGRGSLALAR